ncbi:Uncharacterized protein TCM_018662 [Theobroma cacao]|uniref:Uncharacterized protein n=1 Tax=Theobroma cacao TaxID=3641 RepID=A0A061EMJ9_THECC|nr:Uncharacterized protein TCM_018662 [Theobroma cacao]
MDCAGKIIRTSIHTFLKYFHYFTTIPVLLLLPFSAFVLLSQALITYSSPLLSETTYAQLDSIFDLARFPFSSPLKSQTVFPFLFSLPFALSSFIIAKASIIQAFNQHKLSLQAPFSSFKSLYKPLLLTHLCSLVLIIAITSATFPLLFISLNSLKTFWLPDISQILPAFGAVFYSFLANTIVVANLALVVAGMETCKGHVAIYKACLLRKGKNSMALLLFLPTNMGLVSIEALFRFRVIRVYQILGGLNSSMALEGLLIAYLYSLLIVLDTIICCLFYKSCESNSMASRIHRSCYDIELVQERESFLSKLFFE